MPLIVLLLIVVPIVELFVIVEVASHIGVLETLFLLIAISVAGGWLLKREGAAAWRRFRTTLERGEVPAGEVVDGVMIVFGGALLLTPGFFTDAIGLALLLPPTRMLLRRGARRLAELAVLRRFGVAGTTFSAGKRIYDARVTRDRRVDAPAIPDEHERPAPGRSTQTPPTRGSSSPYEGPTGDEGDSPDRA